MTKKQLPFVGARELISFPKNAISDVPAKVDTGADFSSIWASDIREENGELSFVLFAPGSRYYTGDRIRTKEYSVTLIRNSFGHTEERYKVKILTKLQTKKIFIEYSLADRSANRYPVLIGKKTLQNRFFVDVTRDGVHSAKEPMKVLVMNSSDSKSTREFVDQINASNPELECHFATYDDVSFEIIGNALTCSVLSYNTMLSDYDLIYFKTYFKNAEIAAAMTEVASAQGVEFIDREVATYHALTKLTQYVRLARYGMAVPDSIVLSSRRLEVAFDDMKAKLGVPFVLKDVAGERGESNYLIQNEAEFDAIAQIAKKDDALYVAQRFVKNDGDYRVIVLNKNVELVIERKASGASHLNNVSKGGAAKNIPIDKFGSKPSAIATRAAAIMNRQVAGVDLLYDQVHKKWLILEVNNAPQMVKGSFLKEKQQLMSRFLQEYAKK